MNRKQQRQREVSAISAFFISCQDYDAAGFKIILIDGKRLAQLMIDHNVGVSTVKTYEIKRVDSDYFIEDRDTA